MLVFSVVRIAVLEKDETFAGFMISFYFVMFAMIIISVECNLKKSRAWFYFLNGSLGKALFYLFLFALTFGSGHADASTWADVLLAVMFFIASVLMFVIHCFFKAQEPAYIEQLLQQIKSDAPPAETSKSPATEVTPGKPVANKV